MTIEVLKHHEHWFRALIERSGDGIALMEPDGTMTYASPSTERIIGYTPEELVGRNCTSLIHPDDLQRVLLDVKQMLDHQGDFISIVHRLHHKDGSWRWIDGTITNLLHDPTVKSLVGNYRDITERKLAEERLQQSEERYRVLVEQASDGIFLTDLEGRYVEVNTAACLMSGYSHEELLSKSVEDLTLEEDREENRAGVRALLVGKTTRTLWRMKCKDGSILPIEVSVKRLSTGQYLSIARDVSASVQAEEDRTRLLARERAARAEAEEARAHLHDLFMQAPANIAILRGPNYRIELANPPFLQTIGKAGISLQGKYFRDALPYIASQGFRAILDKVYTTGVPFVGIEMPVQLDRRGDGVLEEGLFNFVYQPFRNADGNIDGILVHGVEVTEQVRTHHRVEELVHLLEGEKEALRRAEQEAAHRAKQLSAIFETITDIVIVCDEQGQVVHANSAFYTGAGLQAGADFSLSVPHIRPAHLLPLDMEGKPLPSEQWPFVRVLKGELLSGKNTIDVFFRDQAGHLRSFDVRGAPIYEESGKIVGGVVVLRDVTKRRQLERRLRRSERKFRSLVESNIIGVIVIDAHGQIYEANDCFVQMLGYDREDLLSGTISWQQLTPPLYREREEQVIATLFATGTVLPWEKEYLCKDGHQLPALVGGTLIDQERGLALEVILDISDRKEAERRKQEFLSMVSHELRTPLTGIVGFIELAQLYLEELPRGISPKIDDLIRKIERVVRQAEQQASIQTRLVEELLDVSRMENHTFELSLKWCNLIKIVQNVVAAQQQIAGMHRIELLQPPQELVSVLVDEDRIGQVLINYLTNALKYAPADQKISVGLTVEETCVRVYVRDRGLGLTPMHQQHIWERFYQTGTSASRTAARSGLGLGLYISKIIVEQHKGLVGVESRLGQGSTFWFTLPLADEASQL